MQRTAGHEFRGKMIVQSLNIQIWGYKKQNKAWDSSLERWRREEKDGMVNICRLREKIPWKYITQIMLDLLKNWVMHVQVVIYQAIGVKMEQQENNWKLR